MPAVPYPMPVTCPPVVEVSDMISRAYGHRAVEAFLLGFLKVDSRREPARRYSPGYSFLPQMLGHARTYDSMCANDEQPSAWFPIASNAQDLFFEAERTAFQANSRWSRIGEIGAHVLLSVSVAVPVALCAADVLSGEVAVMVGTGLVLGYIGMAAVSGQLNKTISRRWDAQLRSATERLPDRIWAFIDAHAPKIEGRVP